MKKISIFLASALMLGLASCDDTSDLGVMQINPQGPVMEANGVAVAFGSDVAGQTLDLNNFSGETVKVLDITKADVPEGTQINTVMQLSVNPDFSNPVEIPVVDGAVSAARLVDYLKASRANSPEARPAYIRFQITGVNDNSTALLGAEYMGQKEIDVISYIPIEAKYYLVGKYLGDNKIDQAVEMSHSPLDVYADPNFALNVEISDEQARQGYTWTVVPASQLGAANFTGCYGANGSAETSGNLVKGGTPGVLKEAGSKKISVNMEYLSYQVTNSFDYLYTPGPANGWGFADNMVLFTSDYVNYSGFVYVDQMFKFTAQPDWSPLNWGGKDGHLVADGDNITVEKSALYFVKANMTEMTYSLEEISKVGLIGGFNSWGGDEELTPSADFKTWTGTLTLTEETEWKFRMNGGWDINLGGTETELTLNGGNIKTAAGTYTVTLDLSKLPYSCTVVKK